MVSGHVKGRQVSESMSSCKTCYGYGIWTVGDPVGVGPLDASDGVPTNPCPECGANANPPGRPRERIHYNDPEISWEDLDRLIDEIGSWKKK